MQLSAYIIHTVPVHWPKAFEELVSSFQPQHLPNVEPERVIWILLEILTVIPEEVRINVVKFALMFLTVLLVSKYSISYKSETESPSCFARRFQRYFKSR